MHGLLKNQLLPFYAALVGATLCGFVNSLY